MLRNGLYRYEFGIYLDLAFNGEHLVRPYTYIPDDSMKDKRFLIGVCASVIWLLFAAWLFFQSGRPESLNDWGDYFAGFFAPLAFLWLVLGYLQQGEELNHSTEALRLQAEELKNSVEQQSQLVAVTREQMKQELESLQEERELRRDAARPKFVPQSAGAVSSSGVTTQKLRIANVGNTATDLFIHFDPDIYSESALRHAMLRRDEALDLQLRIEAGVTTTATIDYIDADGMPGRAEFPLLVQSDGAFRVGRVSRKN